MAEDRGADDEGFLTAPLPMAAMISLRATRGAVLRETGFPHDEQPGALARRLFFDRSLAEEQRGQLRAMNTAPIVSGDRLPLWAIVGQQAQQVWNAKVLPVTGNVSRRYFPARSHLVHATVNTAVCSATSAKVTEPDISVS